MLYVSKVNEKNTLLIKVIIKLSHSAKKKKGLRSVWIELIFVEIEN